MLKLKIENIPEDMKRKKQWVAFKIRNGKKIPFDPKPESGDATASISDPNTWGTFEQAVSMVESGLCIAIGYAMTEEDRFIFVDVDYRPDRCKTEKELEKHKQEVESMIEAVKRFNTYGRRRTEKKQGTRNEMHVVEQSEFPIYEGQHEAIISEEDWYLAQEKRKIIPLSGKRSIIQITHISCPIF